MRKARLLAGIFATVSMIFAVSAGCSSSSSGGDGDTNAANGGGDGGPNASGDGSSSADGTTGPAVITPVANDLTLYLGQITQLDAVGSSVSTSDALAFKWTVVSAPPGSAITTASLFNGGSARPTFTPDLAGVYTLSLTLSAGTQTQVTKNVTVTAYEASSVYLYNEDPGGGSINTAGARAVATASDGGIRDLSCHVTDAGSQDTFVASASMYASDYWEAPPGGVSKVAYFAADQQADAAAPLTLFIAKTDGSCATPPVKLEGYNPSDGLVMDVRFSPNGDRLAYVRKPGGHGDRLVTVGTDGTALHVVAPFGAHADGTPDPDASAPTGSGNNGSVVSLRWLNATKVAWMQFPTGANWQIVTADDVDNSAPEAYMTCESESSSDKPTMFALTSDGSVIVSQRVLFAAGKLGARDLLVYRPNAVTKHCELVRNLTSFTSDGGASYNSASNFSLSPNGSQIAFVATDATIDAGGATATSIWTVAVDGTSPAAIVPGAPRIGADPGSGPHWIAGGALLTWPQQQNTVDSGVNNTSLAIVIAPSAGGVVRVLAKSASAANQTLYGVGTGAACSIGPMGRTSGAALAAIASLACLMFRRRRRS